MGDVQIVREWDADRGTYVTKAEAAGAGGGSFTHDSESILAQTVTPPDDFKNSVIPAGEWLIQVSVAWRWQTTAAAQGSFYLDVAEGLAGSEWIGSPQAGEVATAIIFARASFAVETSINVLADFEGSAHPMEIQFGKVMWWGTAAS